MFSFRLKEEVNKLLDSMEAYHWIFIVLIVISLMAAGIFNLFKKEPDPFESPEIAQIIDRGVLRVGVHNDVIKFSSKNTQGEYEGLEVELAYEIAKSIFQKDYDPSRVEFVEVNFATRTSKLYFKHVDLLIALCENGYAPNNQYSTGYYTDAVGIVSLVGGAEIFADLYGESVGALLRPGINLNSTGALKILQQYSDASSNKFVVTTFASVMDMLEALKNGKIEAFAMEGALIQQYLNETLHVMPDAIGKIEYSVVARDNEPLIKIVNKVLDELRASGQLGEMIKSQGLIDYSIVS